MPPRIVGACRGDPASPFSASGVARQLFAALARRYDVVGCINAELTPIQRVAVALRTFHPRRARWREHFYKHPFGFELQSRNTRRRLRELEKPFDLVVQVYALFQTRGAPYVIYADNTHALTLRHWPAWSALRGADLRRWEAIERRTYLEAAHIFAVGTTVAQSLIEQYGVPERQISVVGGGANFDTLPPPVVWEREPMILFVGREYVRKGADRLVEAFRRVRLEFPEARLAIVGTREAPDEPGIERLGKVADRARLADLYARARVFCLPSRFEPYGFSISEAMAYGLPCVSTPTGAIPEVIVDGETGLLVPPDDSDALAAALLGLMRDPAWAERLGAAGRKRVETYLNWDATVDRMAADLDRLRAGRGQPSRLA